MKRQNIEAAALAGAMILGFAGIFWGIVLQEYKTIAIGGLIYAGGILAGETTRILAKIKSVEIGGLGVKGRPAAPAPKKRRKAMSNEEFKKIFDNKMEEQKK
jgi:hypothetical protein